MYPHSPDTDPTCDYTATFDSPGDYVTTLTATATYYETALQGPNKGTVTSVSFSGSGNPGFPDPDAPAQAATASFSAASGASQQNPAQKIASITVSGTILLTKVSFSGGFDVQADDGTGSYSSPQWVDINKDGNASEVGEKRFPLCFAHNTKMSAQPFFTVSNAKAFNGSLLIKGTGPGNLTFSKVAATLSGTTLSSASPLVCDNSFPNVVNFYNTLNIKWQISKDKGATWIDGGTSDNRVYITLGAPKATLFETTAEIDAKFGSTAGDATNADSIVTAIWGAFSGANAQRKQMDGYNHTDGGKLTYWLNWKTNPASEVDTAGLLKDGNGQCGAWANCFRDCILDEGISDSSKGPFNEYVTSVYTNEAIDSKSDMPGGLLVKNWTFKGAGSAPADFAPFTYAPGEYAHSDNSGVNAQNNINPPPVFSNHYIVRYNGAYYDPSCGHGPYSAASDAVAHASWEDAALDGFTKDFVLQNAAGQQFVYTFAKRNSPGSSSIETKFSP